MNIKLLLLTLCLFVLNISQAQLGKNPPGNSTYTSADINPALLAKMKNNSQKRISSTQVLFEPHAISPLLPTAGKSIIKELNIGGLPVWVEGDLLKGELDARSNLVERSISFFEQNQKIFQIINPSTELKLISNVADQEGSVHLRFLQLYNGLEVWDSEVMLHYKNGKPYLFNGRYIPTPAKDFDLTPSISETEAIKSAKTITQFHELNSNQLALIAGDQVQSNLIIYTEMDKTLIGTLAWKIEIYPNVKDHYTVILDAKNGNVLKMLRHTCHFFANVNSQINGNCAHSVFNPPLDGPATSSANDLNNVSRTVYSYLSGGKYYLINATKSSMFKSSQSSFPDNPVGVIWTLNANNTSVENQSFNVTQISNTSNNWAGNPNAVSAQYNADQAFNYFYNTFNRNSIDGVGGNVISLINVTESDGSGMDNAFWNGKAMFYGNGKTAFKPLAGGLDVGGHEMSHGVIQSTANLTYENESGALNESFADIFGVLIDRDDYKLGEDVVKGGIFPTGAMRDMSNPHNGGSSLNDNGWQPAHMNEKYNGTQDNGGVHINSGIVNFAFYKVASAIGKNDAEKIYYNALTKYLTKSSKFIDCRNAVIQATKEFYNNDAAKIAIIEKAYSDVGIGAGSGTTDPPDYENNPGQDVVIFTNANRNTVEFKNLTNNIEKVITNQVGIISRPSVTDDGNYAVFVGTDQDIYVVEFDWTNNSAQIYTLFQNSSTLFRNVAISKKGDLIAFVVDNQNPIIYVADLAKNEIKDFQLYNPTTGSGTNYTSDVEYADAIEFDNSGSHIMYDASNKIGLSGTEYWDIGFLRAYNTSSKSWDDGKIEKLFGSLPENTSVGNPTFSKNSPSIIALDYLDETQNDYYLVGADVERGNTGLIFTNSEINYPNYSKDDKYVIFNATSTNNTNVIGVQELLTNKIEQSNSNAVILINDANLGNWFGTGSRNLANKNRTELADKIGIFPNIIGNQLNLSWEAKKIGTALLEIYSAQGERIKLIKQPLIQGQNDFKISVNDLLPGIYYLNCNVGDSSKTIEFIKK